MGKKPLVSLDTDCRWMIYDLLANFGLEKSAAGKEVNVFFFFCQRKQKCEKKENAA